MSHVVVFNASAKSVKIPTTPVKYLTEVRDEACQKLSMNKDLFTLKHNNKPIALSQQIRLAGLAQGARLELVQASRSPTVIIVALQLPDKRLTKKLPNNISLWEILRQFESDEGANHNFTQRGVPEMNGASGAGRLNYEMPVITVMPGHKKYATFVELQKTLSQLGFDNGSALLKLGFENSGQPLEEAMAQISQYFKSSEPAASGAHAQGSAQTSSLPELATAAPEATTNVAGETIQQEDSTPGSPMAVDEKAPEETVSEPATLDATIPSTGDVVAQKEDVPPSTSAPSSPTPAPFTRNMQVFLPSTSPTPQAARTAYNEADYIPTVEHAKSHQASLNERSRNTRLLSDKELHDQEKARQEKLKAQADRGGKVRLRLPDGTLVQINITKTDTAQDLYDLAASFLEHKSEPFQLLHRDWQKPMQMTPLARNASLLFKDLGLWNSEMVTFRWDEAASNAVRGAKNVLSEEWQAKAQTLRVEEPVSAPAGADQQAGQTLGKTEGKKKVDMSAEEKEHKLKNILKGGIFKMGKK
ncbi:hypothetical protein CC80DRAFT_497351 [Byssothecium circinans]|uniref:UBX domain-containing protein n=1 Tax=Byssothecium circinans TaxID=147558 RepID=A0A6A5TCZ9_9PLEO|nr:hypothetical protein CC80DRAFT_497351 [Byssothecium circinans]